MISDEKTVDPIDHDSVVESIAELNTNGYAYAAVFYDKESIEESGKTIWHIIGYPEYPTVMDLKNAIEELMSDDDFKLSEDLMSKLYVEILSTVVYG